MARRDWANLCETWRNKSFTDFDPSLFEDEIAIRGLSLDLPLPLLKLDIFVLWRLVALHPPEKRTTIDAIFSSHWCIPRLIAIIKSDSLDHRILCNVAKILKELYIHEMGNHRTRDVVLPKIENHEGRMALWEAAQKTINPTVFGACSAAFGHAFLNCETSSAAALEFGEALSKKWLELRSDWEEAFDADVESETPDTVGCLLARLNESGTLQVFRACAPIINENLQHDEKSVVATALDLCADAEDGTRRLSTGGFDQDLMKLFPNLAEAVLKGLRAVDESLIFPSVSILTSMAVSFGTTTALIHNKKVFDCFLPMLTTWKTVYLILFRILDCITVVGCSRGPLDWVVESGCVPFILAVSQDMHPPQEIRELCVSFHQ